MKKIRVFLGAYLNSTNAQNLNCLSLARYLDKERFEVYALTLYSGNLEPPKIEGVKTFSCFRPHRISRYLGFLWGILRCDVAYLPKGELCRWNKFWLRMLGKRSFRTVEGIYGEEMLGQILESGMSYEAFKAWFRGYDRLYSITKFLAEYNRKRHGIETEPEPLYLGTETETFRNGEKKITALENIVFIGRLKRRKGVFELLALARKFPDIRFHLVGEGEERAEVEAKIEADGLRNVTLHGRLDHTKLAKLLVSMDLHVFPSRSEGFPKVTLETAAAGVPSLVYSDYGAGEWIESGVNGFVVDIPEEMEKTIAYLAEKPETLQSVSENARKMAQRFDWKNVVKDWEKILERLSKHDAS